MKSAEKQNTIYFRCDCDYFQRKVIFLQRPTEKMWAVAPQVSAVPYVDTPLVYATIDEQSMTQYEKKKLKKKVKIVSCKETRINLKISTCKLRFREL